MIVDLVTGDVKQRPLPNISYATLSQLPDHGQNMSLCKMRIKSILEAVSKR